MKISLTEEQVHYLICICSSVGEHQRCLAEQLINSSISSNDVDELCELISNEFMLNGLEVDFEPNDYGRKLEHLLDAINRGRLLNNRSEM